MIHRKEDNVVSVQVVAKTLRGKLLAIIFMNLFDALIIIWVRGRYQLMKGCIVPRGIYRPKGGIPYIFSMNPFNKLVII